MGDSGLVKIDRYGDRSEFDLVIKKMDEENGKVVGTWNPKNGLLLSAGASKGGKKGTFSQSLEPLVITTVLVILKIVDQKEIFNLPLLKL